MTESPPPQPASEQQPAVLVPPKKYTSSFNGQEIKTLGGVGVFPVRFTKKSGGEAAGTVCPAIAADEPEPEAGFSDILDEVLYYMKARLLLRTFPMEGAGDRLSLYLTLYLQSCIRRLSKQTQPLQAKDAYLALYVLAGERMVQPGDNSYPFNAMYPKLASSDVEPLREYLKQLRYEVGYRLVDRIYAFPNEENEGPNKFWMSFARKDFLGHMLEL